VAAYREAFRKVALERSKKVSQDFECSREATWKSTLLIVVCAACAGARTRRANNKKRAG
jgi:hypothetical protein